MAIYPLIHKPDFSYHDFLMHDQYIGDIKNGIRSATSDVLKGQALSTKILNDTLNKNSDFIASTIDSGFTGLRGDIYTMSDNVSSSVDRVGENVTELKNTMEGGFDTLGNSVDNVASGILTLNENMTNGLKKVDSSIQDFHSDFNIAMGGVALQFEMLREEMKQGFNSIISILENKRKTDAEEDFRDAIEFYNDGCNFIDKPIWFKNAHKHFSASIEKYERNPLAHLHLAHIYHYQEEFRDFDKALEHYELCYTYGEADEKSNAVTAQGYFYAGWLKASVFDDLDSAIKLTEEALIFDAKLSEAYYNLAAFYSLKNDKSNALKNLKTAIVKFDRNYMMKAESDTNFDNIRDSVHKLFNDMLTDLKNNIESSISNLKNNYPDDIKKESARKEYNTIWRNIQNTKQQANTYFSSLNATLLISNFGKQLETLSKQQLKSEAHYSMINQIKTFVSNRVCTNEIYHKKTLGVLEKAEQLFIARKYNETLLSFLSILDQPLKIDIVESTKVVSKCDVAQISFVDNKSIALLYISDLIEEDVEFINFDNSQVILKKDAKSRSIEDFADKIAIDKNERFMALAYFGGEKIEICDINNNLKCISTLRGHGDRIEYLEFSPDGKYLLSSSGYDDKNVRLWDIEKGSCLLTIPSEELKPSPVAFSPCGKYFIVANPDVYLYEMDGYRKELLCKRYAYGVNMVYSPDGKYIAYGGHREIFILDIATKQQYDISMINKDTWIQNISYSPSGNYIAVGDGEGTTSICDVESKKIVLSLFGSDYANVQYSPDGRYVATKCGISGKVYLWDIYEIIDKNFDTDLILDQLKSYYTMTKNEYKEQLEQKNFKKKDKSDLEKWKEKRNLELKKIKTYKRKDGRIYFLTKLGLVPQGQKTPTYNYESSLSLIKNLNEFICIDDNANEINNEIMQQRRAGRQCEICGEKLGMMDKMFGKIRCKEHR